MLALFLILFSVPGELPEDASSAPEVQASQFSIFESVDGDEYILGAGDILQVVVEGGISEVMMVSGLGSITTSQVSGDGRIQVSGIGQLSVTGLTINQAEQALRALTRRYYSHVEIGLSLLQPRTVRVWITGMVAHPGRYTLYAINRVSDLVSAAGGMSSYSSRTGWMITETGDSVYVDLHFDPLTGKPVCDPFVDGGAGVVFELLISPVYVLRPGVRNYNDAYAVPEVETWDAVPGETVEDLMYRIGGISGNIDLARSVLITRRGTSPVWVKNQGFSLTPVEAGDTLRLVVEGNDIYVAGAVHQRGIISYTPGATARVYVERAGGKVYNASIGGTTVTRNGVVIASGDDALETEVLPGDVIEVPYNWVAQHAQEIGILATVVGITSVIINLSR
ncbi:MAG: polysaccharide biosynthesis/export family protein [Candidatus Fermentibacteraceae bacterium]|nr:polysaccharide biosynthesis/export family protein [Candidatus Fermentibacteraceae bacterium]